MNNSAAPVVSATRIKRQYRTAEEKRQIVEETLGSGVSVAVVARAHSVNANLVFHWRKLYHAGLLGERAATSLGQARASGVRLLPVSVAEEAENQPPVAAAVSTPYGVAHEAAIVPGSMELTLAKAQIRITGRVDAQVLRVVLECLRG
ncbi:MAG TPA: transposase [Terriglobales bacterium]|nr:transposase [Terriglobales bacterium]